MFSSVPSTSLSSLQLSKIISGTWTSHLAGRDTSSFTFLYQHFSYTCFHVVPVIYTNLFFPYLFLRLSALKHHESLFRFSSFCYFSFLFISIIGTFLSISALKHQCMPPQHIIHPHPPSTSVSRLSPLHPFTFPRRQMLSVRLSVGVRSSLQPTSCQSCTICLLTLRSQQGKAEVLSDELISRRGGMRGEVRLREAGEGESGETWGGGVWTLSCLNFLLF